jgi:hypothetical protein
LADLAPREMEATLVLLDRHGRKASHRATIVLRSVGGALELVKAQSLLPLEPVWRRTWRHPIRGEWESVSAKPTHAALLNERGDIVWLEHLSRVGRRQGPSGIEVRALPRIGSDVFHARDG